MFNDVCKMEALSVEEELLLEEVGVSYADLVAAEKDSWDAFPVQPFVRFDPDGEEAERQVLFHLIG